MAITEAGFVIVAVFGMAQPTPMQMTVSDGKLTQFIRT